MMEFFIIFAFADYYKFQFNCIKTDLIVCRGILNSNRLFLLFSNRIHIALIFSMFMSSILVMKRWLFLFNVEYVVR